MSHHPKRERTAGENLFDVATYGGFSLLGNELLSTVISKEAKYGALGKKYYAPFEQFFAKLPGLKKLDYIGEGRMPYILVATIGGMFTVLPVKWMEDRKGGIVRMFDRLLHGRTTDDPKLESAHREMDHAPKQTWRSLWEGRITTVVSALAVDWLFGWHKGISAKLADTFNFMKDIASFDRLAATGARHIVLKTDQLKKHFGFSINEANHQHIKNILANVHDIDKRFIVDPKREGKSAQWLAIGGALLTLSASLTVLFYASSKMFARGQEEKRERKLERQKNPQSYSFRDVTESEGPDNKITDATHGDRIKPTADLSTAVGV